MELYKEILKKILEREYINIEFPKLKRSATDMVEMQSYETLKKIKACIENDRLEDFECIEKIVYLFEEIGSDGGNRHDFG